MLNKKLVLAVGGGIVCLAVGIGVIKGNKAPTESVSAMPFKAAAAEGTDLLSEIKRPVDLEGSLKKDEFIPIEVKKAFIDDGGCARVIVHNNTNTPIVAYDLELIYYNEKGMPLRERGNYTVNGIILPANQDIGLDKFVGGSNGGKYINAIVKKALYYDGTVWENPYAKEEAVLKNTTFDIEGFEKAFAKNEENVEKATHNKHVFINDMTMTNADEIVGRRDLKLVLTNTSTREIRDIKVAVAEFDKDNNPIDVSPQIYVSKNVRLAVCKGMELKVGESRAFASSGFLENDCYRINAIVTEVTFADGIIWKNPYALDWLLWFT